MRGFAIVLVLCVGCTDLGDYRADYAGEVSGAVACAEGEDGPCSFIRRGFRGGTRLTVQGFDPTVQSLASGSPGTLTTDDAECGPGTETLVDEPLRPIPALAHDALSEMQMPGSGRLRTLVYALEPERGALAGRHAMAFVTLLESGTIEVRVVSGDGSGEDCASPPVPPTGTPADCPRRAAGECDFFGVFELFAGAP